MPADILSDIRQELRQQADEKTRAGYQQFFKEGAVFYGVKTMAVNRLAARYYPRIKPLGKSEIFRLCEELWKSDYSEEAFIACDWSFRLRKEFEPGDITVFERWLSCYVNNWAKCDSLCNHTIAAFIEMYPRFIEKLKAWTKSPNRWLRRGAAVTLILPARQGKFLQTVFEIADDLLTDRDDLVQKGYGWLLKDASIQHRDEVFDYVIRHKKLMPRTALRYAIERMPEALKRQAMAKDA